MSVEDIGVIGWQKNSFIDFPGTVSTVLFFRGCNLRCPYCHNPDIVLNRLPYIPFSEIDAFLEKRKKVITGVVLSGGEPTLHADLPKIVEKIRLKGFLIKLDTNGLNPEMIKKCMPDYCALDIKTVPDGYAALGCALSDAAQRLSESIAIVKGMGNSGEVRITVVNPFVNNENINAIAEAIKGVSKVFLQKLVVKNQLLCSESLLVQNVPAEILEYYRSLVAEYTGICSIRGAE